MAIGISTSCFYPILTEETFPYIAELGFRKIEIFLNAPSETDEDFCCMMRRRVDEQGLTVVSVHPFCGAYEYVNLFSQYRRRRDDALMDYERIARAAEILGAKYVTFHGDRLNSPLPAPAEMYCEVLLEIMSIMEAHGLKLAQENVCWCRSSAPEFLAQVAKTLRPEGLKFTLDVKQALRAGHSWQDYLPIMGSDIVNVHISDSCEGNTCMLPGTGTMDYQEFFEVMHAVGYRGDYLIEIYQKNYTHHGELAMAGEYLRKYELFDKK